MKKLSKHFLIFFLSLIFAASIFGQDKKVENNIKSKQTKIEKQSESKKIWNAFCPVMGDPVDPEVQTVEYKGKLIGFCCKSCIKKFQKEPEKYLMNLSSDGQKFIKKTKGR